MLCVDIYVKCPQRREEKAWAEALIMYMSLLYCASACPSRRKKSYPSHGFSASIMSGRCLGVRVPFGDSDGDVF